VELQQSPFLALISDRQVQKTLALMGQPKEARLTPEIAQQVCERTGSAAVLEGSIANVGKPICTGPRREELQHRKHSGPGAGGVRPGEKTS